MDYQLVIERVEQVGDGQRRHAMVRGGRRQVRFVSKAAKHVCNRGTQPYIRRAQPWSEYNLRLTQATPDAPLKRVVL